MRTSTSVLALFTAVVLGGCGGGSATSGDQTLKIPFSSQVVFGDSLSDVGTYAVGTVAALGGGKFTINGNNTAINPALTGKNWTELIGTQLGLPPVCAAQTGLNGSAALGFSVPVVNHPGCLNYAQGGARVSNPIGPSNAATGSPLGALTVPVSTQIQNHLAAVGGKFSGTELVFVMAGGNDVLFLLAQLTADATVAGNAAGATAFATALATGLAAGAANPASAAQAIGLAIASASAAPGSGSATIVTAAVTAAAGQPGNAAVASPAVNGPIIAAAQAAATAAGNSAGAAYLSATGPSLVAAMSTAGSQLVALVKSQLLANGAKYVAVNNLPDVANTPSGLSQSASAQALIAAMVQAFNSQLSSGLANDGRIVLVDVYAVSHDQATNPAPYGLTNVTTPACDLSPARNVLGSSLVCNASNLIPGDVSHYSYADTVHPTPFNNLLLARYVSEQLVVRGWF